MDIRAGINRLTEGYDNRPTIGKQSHYDSQVMVESRLSRYEKELGEITGEEHIEDINLFLAYLQQSPDKTNLFKEKCRFRSVVGKNISWVKADLLFIDSPYKPTGLEEFCRIHGKHKPWAEYIELISHELLPQFVDLLIALGAMDRLVIAKTSVVNNSKLKTAFIHNNRSKYVIDEDYTMINVGRYTFCKSVVASRLIWEAVVSEKRDVTKAQYRPRFRSSVNIIDSQVVNVLSYNAWIPDRNGFFHKPRNMTESLLREDFPYDDRNGLLQAIGFGLDALKSTMLVFPERTIKGSEHNLKKVEEEEPPAAEDIIFTQNADEPSVLLGKDDTLAKHSNISSPEVGKDLVADIIEFDSEQDRQEYLVHDFMTRITQCSKRQKDDIVRRLLPILNDDEPDFDVDNANDDSFPEEQIKDVLHLQRVQDRVTKNHAIASDVIYEYVTRRIRTSRIGDKDHIKHRYKGYCQHCGMPSPYWEIAEISKSLRKEMPEMNLSLCPNHASEYRQLRENESAVQKFIEGIVTADITANPRILIANFHLQFTQIHLAEIQQILKMEKM